MGLLLTPITVIKNIAGGDKPAENNARILLHQAYYFIENNRFDIAYYLAKDARSFIATTSVKDKDTLLSISNDVINRFKAYGEGKKLDPIWLRPLPQNYKQLKAAGICVAAWTIALGSISIFTDYQSKVAREGAPEYSYQQPADSNTPSPSTTLPQTDEAPAPPIPTTYLPLSTGYLPDKKIAYNNGHSVVTIDNNSDANFHVKLYKRDSVAWAIGREVYLRANEQFIMEDLDPGEYEIRRLDVQTKVASKTDPFTLEETQETNGVRYSRFTLTFKAIKGNSRIIPISAKEF